MADIDSPRPFRRERNLSNRNFAKRGSNRRRLSTDSHASTDSRLFEPICDENAETPTNGHNNSLSQPPTPSATTMSCKNILHSVSSDTVEASVNHKPKQKNRSLDFPLTSTSTATIGDDDAPQSHEDLDPESPDPALLDVKQKLLMFENFHTSDRFKAAKFKSLSTQSLLNSERRLNYRKTKSPSPKSTTSSISSSNSGSYSIHDLSETSSMGNEVSVMDKRYSAFHQSIDEERSEDDVDGFEVAEEVFEEGATEKYGTTSSMDNNNNLNSGSHRESLKGEHVSPVAAMNTTLLAPFLKHSQSHGDDETNQSDEKQTSQQQQEGKQQTTKPPSKDFPRNFRSRPLTEIAGSQTLRVRGEKYNSLRSTLTDADDEEQIELRDKGYGCIQPILDELIKTEESYVENLWTGIRNYGNIFEHKDLPMGLRGMKYILFGNVEQLAEFHRDEFLPMLHRNRHDLKRLFDEFLYFIEQNYFYGYVLYTMNKQSSLKLCDIYKNYFKGIQTELDDKLGINSFLVQPIQRMARYPLLLTQFITTLFKNRDFILKPVIESCCRLEKKLRTLLTTINESEIINDIVCLSETHEFNTAYQGKFRKVSEFHVHDHTLKRSYRSKVFMFDKCIIYTEIKGKQLIFHGRYPCEHIGITPKTNSFTLFYEQRKMQECDFSADQTLIEQWLELIREMMTLYAKEERKRFKEKLALEQGEDHIHPKPANLSLFRDSNRFSTDSGIGNMWVVPKAEVDEPVAANRTTWYATS
uniref:DH domain-containing protein n=1 Tax=Stomoxys calcitrans TaxID=35570 RepID=A0A1I8P4R1_STOCA